jgi:hypothetical protein
MCLKVVFTRQAKKNVGGNVRGGVLFSVVKGILMCFFVVNEAHWRLGSLLRLLFRMVGSRIWIRKNSFACSLFRASCDVS